MFAKQNGHIVHLQAAKLELLGRLCMDDGQGGAISTGGPLELSVVKQTRPPGQPEKLAAFSEEELSYRRILGQPDRTVVGVCGLIRFS